MIKYNGAFDNRTDKSKDFQWDEVNTMGAIYFPVRDPVGYTVRNQDGSNSCVAQTAAKMLEIWDFKHDATPTVYSATPIYKNRSNKPAVGMSGVDAFSYPIKNGTWLEKDIPSQEMNDEQMDNSTAAANAQVERPTAYLVMPIDFYAVASEIDKSGAVMLWFKCSYEEWCQDVPSGNSGSEAVRHSVCAVDKITWKGNEYIIIEDSWGTWQNISDVPLKSGQRAITKYFFDKHCYFAGCFTTFSFDGTAKPHHTWSKSMKYGQTSEDIKQLQEVLKYEGYFPSNQKSTGFFGGITAKALIKWQVANGMNDFAKETSMYKVQAGPKSIALLNKLYSG